MNNSSIPPGTSARGSALGPPTAADTLVQLTQLDAQILAELETDRVVLKLKGEIINAEEDGTVRIRTERGDVEVRVQDNAREAPRRGERIEIEIRPSRTDTAVPDTARIKIAPADYIPQDPRITLTPLDIEVQPSLNLPDDTPISQTRSTYDLPPPLTPQSTQALPPEGSLIRLTPATPQDVNIQTLPAPEILTVSLPDKINFEAQAIVQNEISSLVTFPDDALPIQIPVQNPSPPPQVVSLIQSHPLPVISAAPPPTQANIVVEAPTQHATAPRVVLIPPAENAGAPVTVPVDASPEAPLAVPTLQAHPVIRAEPAQNLLPAGLEQPRPQAIDARITQIVPPQIIVQAPAVSMPTSAPVNIDANPPSQGQTYLPQTRNVPEAAIVSSAEIAQPQRQTYLPQMQNAPEAAIVQNQRAGQTVGVITHVSPTHTLPVVQIQPSASAPVQHYTLQFPAGEIAPGTQIQFTPVASPQQIPHAAAETTQATLQSVPLPVFLAPQTPWPAVDQVLQALAQAAPQTAQAMINVTPSPANPAQLGPALMFFIAAVRGGDLGQWLGDKASEVLKTQKGGQALNRLLGEGQTMARVAAEPVSQDWRALNIPLYWDNDIQKVALYYRHEREDQDHDEGGVKSTRFVFDFALDRMGKVQLDGLYRPVSNAGKRLDLVLRTQDDFAQSTRAEMRRIYAAALKASDISGELSFQNQPDGWVTIQTQEESRLGVNA